MSLFAPSVTLDQTLAGSTAGGHGAANFRVLSVGEPKPIVKKNGIDDVHTVNETREVQHLEDRVIEVPRETVVEKVVEIPEIQTVEKVVEEIIEVPVIEYEEQIVEKHVDRIVEVEKIVSAKRSWSHAMLA